MSIDPRATPSDKLSLATIFTFSAGSLPVAALGVALFVYLPPYLAGHLGVGLTVVGTSWAIVRFIDIGVDPILGLVMDRTRTQYGRYRVWLMIGAPIFMLGVYQLFLAKPGIGGFYLVSWLLVLYLGISILYLAHSAWAATLATQYHERSRVFGILAAVGVVAAVALLLIPIFAHAFGQTDAQGIQAMGWLLILLTPFAIGLTAWRTPERIATDLHASHVPLKDYLQLIAKPEVIRLMLAQMALTLGPGWMSAIYLFYFKASRGYTSEQATILLIAYIVAGIAGAAATGRLAMRFGKHRTLMATTTAYSLGLCTIVFIPKASVLAGMPVMLWCGFMAAGFDLMIRAMLADVGDEVRLEQGKERISLLYALIALAAKVAAAFAIALTYPLLARIGFNPAEGAVNTPAAVHGLELAFLIGPIVFVMLGGACMIGWRLDAARHGDIRTRLDARDLEYAEALVIEGAPVPAPASAFVPNSAQV